MHNPVRIWHYAFCFLCEIYSCATVFWRFSAPLKNREEEEEEDAAHQRGPVAPPGRAGRRLLRGRRQGPPRRRRHEQRDPAEAPHGAAPPPPGTGVPLVAFGRGAQRGLKCVVELENDYSILDFR